MQKIKENIESFFIIWSVILFLNQVVLFGGCFNPICLIAALPHTGVIAFLISIFVTYETIFINHFITSLYFYLH